MAELLERLLWGTTVEEDIAETEDPGLLTARVLELTLTNETRELAEAGCTLEALGDRPEAELDSEAESGKLKVLEITDAADPLGELAIEATLEVEDPPSTVEWLLAKEEDTGGAPEE